MPDEQPKTDKHGNPPPYYLQQGSPPEDPPFVGPLAYEAQMAILAKGDEWREQGVKLDHSILLLQASGPGLPRGMEISGVCAGADGNMGAQMEVGDLLNALADTISLTAGQVELRDPFKELDDLKDAVLAFVKEAQEVKDQTEGKTWWQRLRFQFPSRKREARLILAVNRYLKIVTHIKTHGYADTPDEDVAGVEDLSRRDFEK